MVSEYTVLRAESHESTSKLLGQSLYLSKLQICLFFPKDVLKSLLVFVFYSLPC